MNPPNPDEPSAERRTTVPVVAAVIRDGDRFLLGRRPPQKRHGGLWEFPGGKMLDGEDHLAAARRELREELDLQATGQGEPLYAASDPGSPFVIHFVEIDVRGTPRAHEHTEVGWFTVAELRGMALAPSDAAFVSWLAREDP